MKKSSPPYYFRKTTIPAPFFILFQIQPYRSESHLMLYVVCIIRYTSKMLFKNFFFFQFFSEVYPIIFVKNLQPLFSRKNLSEFLKPHDSIMVATQFWNQNKRTNQDKSGHFRAFNRTNHRQKRGHFRTILQKSCFIRTVRPK